MNADPSSYPACCARTRTVPIGSRSRCRAARRAATALGDGLVALDRAFPGLRFRIIDEQGRIRPHIKLFVDGTQARDLAAPLPPAATLMIVGALSGG